MHTEIDEDFLNSLFGQDTLGVVVRAHIHIEARLNEIIRLLVGEPELLPKMRFEQRVNLAGALGLTSQALPPLKALGDIRNAFGHRLNVTLTREMVWKLWNTFSPEHKQVVLSGHQVVRREFPDQPWPDFESLGPRDMFISLATALDKMLISAQAEIFGEEEPHLVSKKAKT